MSAQRSLSKRGPQAVNFLRDCGTGHFVCSRLMTNFLVGRGAAEKHVRHSSRFLRQDTRKRESASSFGKAYVRIRRNQQEAPHRSRK